MKRIVFSSEKLPKKKVTEYYGLNSKSAVKLNRDNKTLLLVLPNKTIQVHGCRRSASQRTNLTQTGRILNSHLEVDKTIS